jgi:flagellar motor switch protein FliM
MSGIGRIVPIGGATLSQTSRVSHDSPQEPVSHETGGVARFDFRRPSKFGREHVRSLESLHESFGRRLAGLMTHALRCLVQLRFVSADELTYENYIRSLPNPSVLTLVTLDPLPGTVVMEMSSQMGLMLVDRVLGGLGSPGAMRRPTELEMKLMNEVVQYSVDAFAETFSPLLEVAPKISSVESNPHFVQVVPPSETTLLLSFAFSVSASATTEGLLTLCYPISTLQPVMERLQQHESVRQAHGLQPENTHVQELLTGHLLDIELPVSVRLKTTSVAANDVAMLQPGDVLALDHSTNEPARGVVNGVELFEGFIGRRNKRLGVRLSSWRSIDE